MILDNYKIVNIGLKELVRSFMKAIIDNFLL
jgi:hypothetical protein